MEDIAEDIYTIFCKTTKKSIHIDLRTPFIMNSISTIINVPYEDIVIKNSIGDIIATILKEDLLTIEELDEIGEPITYFFLNLYDILFEPIEIQGYKYSKLYPLKELELDEFGLSNGKIITGKDIIVNIKAKELVKTEVETLRIVNYTNGNYFKRLDDNLHYYDEQIIEDEGEKYVVKLNSVSIEKGSLNIEEYYGEGEQYTSIGTNEIKYLNINTIDSPQYLEVDTDTYLQE